MPPRLRAHSVAVADPSAAAHQVASAALGDAPRSRPLLLLLAGWGAHPGLRPAPWVLDGTLRAVQESGLKARAARLATDPFELRKTPAGRIYRQPVTQLDISATHIRGLVAEGRNPRFLLPDSVLDIIRQENPYF